MPTYSISFAQANLADLVARAEAGEEVTLASDREPVARLIPVTRQTMPRRRPGRLKGLITVGPEFFEPLPDDELAAWEGGG